MAIKVYMTNTVHVAKIAIFISRKYHAISTKPVITASFMTTNRVGQLSRIATNGFNSIKPSPVKCSVAIMSIRLEIHVINNMVCIIFLLAKFDSKIIEISVRLRYNACEVINMDVKEAITKRVNELLSAHGRDVSDLRGYNLPETLISAIAAGDPVDPKIEELDNLCSALHINVHSFMDSDFFRK